ncbi:MAG TPA: hypothetical protein VFS15_28490 [Kofleriaceae bacterium]|nr:hypothetical protein [Kofleriaceae bacterium]
MKRTLAILALAAGSAGADAPSTEPAGGGTRADLPAAVPPTGWHVEPAQSVALADKLRGVSHFGLDASTTTVTNATVYVPPERGVVLSVVLVATKLSENREAAARAAVDELHATSQRAALAGSGIVEDGWQEKVDPAAKQIEATLAWRDTAAKTSSSARLVIAADMENLIAVTGECFSSDDANPKLVADCMGALATLDPGIAPAQRVALALAPTGTRPEPAAGSGAGAPSMSEGPHTPLPPINVPQEAPTPDRRPVYVGIGLVVLAAAFWWNRRRRARQEDRSDER